MENRRNQSLKAKCATSHVTGQIRELIRCVTAPKYIGKSPGCHCDQYLPTRCLFTCSPHITQPCVTCLVISQCILIKTPQKARHKIKKKRSFHWDGFVRKTYCSHLDCGSFKLFLWFNIMSEAHMWHSAIYWLSSVFVISCVTVYPEQWCGLSYSRWRASCTPLMHKQAREWVYLRPENQAGN